MQHLETYLASRKQKHAYQYALWLLSWDQETETPEASLQYRSDQIEVLSTLLYEVEMSDARIEAIDYLALNPSTLTKELQVEIKQVKKELDHLRKNPKTGIYRFPSITLSSRPYLVTSQTKQ